MSKLDELIAVYRKLCAYCDDLFEKALSSSAGQMNCREGCWKCCTIQTVTRLEAFIIEEYIRKHSMERDKPKEGACVFLQEGICTIYPVRPIICRTHGLILFNSEDKSFNRSCDMNFKDVGVRDRLRACVVDTVNITENLIRLNLAYMRIEGINDTDGGRVDLVNI